MFDKVIVSCEHGGNQVPEEYKSLFEGQEELLKSHRGWDPGALEAARYMAEILKCMLYYGENSRLIIELNRSTNAPDLYSEITRNMTEEQKNMAMISIYQPYWESIEKAVEERTANGETLLHLSIHSFTPQLDGEKRDADIGILFDTDREIEVRAAVEMRARLEASLPGLKIKDNYPYLGISDCLTTSLRQRFSQGNYAGIEIEINQDIPIKDGPIWASVKEGLASAAEALMKK